MPRTSAVPLGVVHKPVPPLDEVFECWKLRFVIGSDSPYLCSLDESYSSFLRPLQEIVAFILLPSVRLLKCVLVLARHY
jgi:hypothetical protein